MALKKHWCLSVKAVAFAYLNLRLERLTGTFSPPGFVSGPTSLPSSDCRHCSTDNVDKAVYYKTSRMKMLHTLSKIGGESVAVTHRLKPSASLLILRFFRERA